MMLPPYIPRAKIDPVPEAEIPKCAVGVVVVPGTELIDELILKIKLCS
jgi:hypothetical protein